MAHHYEIDAIWNSYIGKYCIFYFYNNPLAYLFYYFLLLSFCYSNPNCHEDGVFGLYRYLLKLFFSFCELNISEFYEKFECFSNFLENLSYFKMCKINFQTGNFQKRLNFKKLFF